ncbi:MAG TPA: hypothetical protein VGD91_01370, partial [Trebonia sp.]
PAAGTGPVGQQARSPAGRAADRGPGPYGLCDLRRASGPGVLARYVDAAGPDAGPDLDAGQRPVTAAAGVCGCFLRPAGGVRRLGG